MTKLWSLLRNQQTEQRFTLDDYAKMLQNSPYPVGFMNRGVSNAYEEPDEEFQTYIYQAYKADGIVFACMLARQMLFSEARFQFQRLRKGRPGDLFGTPDLSILENPWPNGTTGELLSRAIQDVDLGGNHYVLRESSTRLRRLRPDWVQIVLTQPPDTAVKSDVAGYLYMPGGPGGDPKKWELYPVEGDNGRIAHWSPIPDPDAQYKGMSWLTPVIREIFADIAATRHKAKFFENAATPNLAISLKESVTRDQFQEFMELMDSAKGGIEHAYETLYLGGGADVTVIGQNMHQMDFKNTQGAGETRIAAAARVPAIVVGLSEGLSGSSLNEGNYNSAKKQFGDAALRPLWRSICAAYSSLVPVPTDVRLWFDDRDIEYLRADRLDVANVQNVQARTMSSLIQSGYEPDSIVAALEEEDWSLLKHTGLFSVQLQPAGGFTPQNQPVTPVAPTDPKKTKATNGPDEPAKVSTIPPKKVTPSVPKPSGGTPSTPKAPAGGRDVSKLPIGPGHKLWEYWTAGKGLGRWIGAVHKWTTLHRLLLEAGVPSHEVDGLTTNIINFVLPGYMKLAHHKQNK